MRVREFNKHRVRGKFPSIKTGRMVYWESLNEEGYYRILDFDPQVTEYQEQPFKIAYIYDVNILVRRNRCSGDLETVCPELETTLD